MPSPSPFTGEGGTRSAQPSGRVRGYKSLQLRAREMRLNPTDAEHRLWSMLRDRRMLVFKFRRQFVIERYIVDFICFERRLIIEADGSQHAESEYDQRRDAFLRAQGFSVLRFWNNDVLQNASGVFEAIYAELTTPAPSQACGLGPSLSRKGRGASWER